MKVRRINISSSILVFTVLWMLIGNVQLHFLRSTKVTDNAKEKGHPETARMSVIKKVPTVGFRNLVANWTFVQFLQYFGDTKAREQRGYDSSSSYLSTAIHHDPYFTDLYVFLSGSTTLYAGRPEDTVKVMSEGLAQLDTKRAPDSYYVWRYKGTDELLFLNDSESAKHSFDMAANWASEFDDDESNLVMKVSQQTVQFLTDNPDSKQAQINAWSSLFSTAIDKDTRDRAVKKIEELGGSVLLFEDGSISIRYEKVKEAIEAEDDSDT